MEIYYNGEWGTLCNYGWDLNDAQVVCRQLGFGAVISIADKAYVNKYGAYADKIWYNDLNCTGNELTIENCSHTGWSNGDFCRHRRDAGVVCYAPKGNFQLSMCNS